MSEREEFHFVGVVERAETKQVETKADPPGPKPKYDVYAVGAGPDSNVSMARRIALWRWRKGKAEDAEWWPILEAELAKAVGLAPGPKIPLRFSGTRTPAEKGGYFYDGNKVEVYDPEKHGTTSSSPSTNGGAGSAGPATGGSERRTTADPTAVTVADGIAAVTALLARLPKETTDRETGEVRGLTPAEQSQWLYERSLSLLRVARRAAVDVSREPVPEPPRPGEGRS